MQSLQEQIKEIHNKVAESQWKIMWGKSIEETAKEIIEKCLYNDQCAWVYGGAFQEK